VEWLTPLRGTVVCLDTAPLIYFIEENPTYLAVMRPFFEAVDRTEIQAVTSVLTLTEVLVHPLRSGDRRLADRYRQILLHARNVKTGVVSESIAEAAAELRGKYGLRTPDAIQVATALDAGASSLLTNDSRLSRLTKPKVLVLDDLITSAA